MGHADRNGWDDTTLRAEEEDLCEKLDQLRQNADWLVRIRSAHQAAKDVWKSPTSKDADIHIERAVGLVRGYRYPTCEDCEGDAKIRCPACGASGPNRPLRKRR